MVVGLPAAQGDWMRQIMHQQNPDAAISLIHRSLSELNKNNDHCERAPEKRLAAFGLNLAKPQTAHESILFC